MRFSSPLVKVAICCGSFFLFLYSFKINELFDSIAQYANGINLVFIPAGIKLLCLLVGGEAALVGLLLSNVYVSMGVWENTSVMQMIYFAITAVGSYYVTVLLVKKLMRIDDTLSNLRYLHIIILSAVGSILNGFVHNVVYVWQDKVKAEDFFANATAMVVGDFLGCFIVIMFFNVCIDLAFRLMDSERSKDQSGVRFIAHFLNRART
jgi:integral membrane sensor domain MASE1